MDCASAKMTGHTVNSATDRYYGQRADKMPTRTEHGPCDDAGAGYMMATAAQYAHTRTQVSPPSHGGWNQHITIASYV